MCNGKFASKLTENAVILCYNFSLSDCHFSLIFLQPAGRSHFSTARAQLEPCKTIRTLIRLLLKELSDLVHNVCNIGQQSEYANERQTSFVGIGGKKSYLLNEFDFWKVHGIMNTSGLLQSYREA